jgi:hypothetical protein
MINNMMTTSEEFPDWFVDLLILRATDGLDDEQQSQFDQFVEDHPDRERIELEAEKYELTIAAVDLGIENVSSRASSNPMPEVLRKKVLDGAKRHFESDSRTEEIMPAVAVAPRKADGLTSREAFAWLVSAAAVILLLTGWNPFAFPVDEVARDTAVVEVPSLNDQLADFVDSDKAGLVRVAWMAPDNKTVDKGEVVWRDSAQEGFMVFDGLRANDPAQSQYQLWIFDTTTDQKHPVDGGVFNVVDGKPTIVPIDARIPVEKAVMFAITEEVPGGVVVSTRERLPLLAVVE